MNKYEVMYVLDAALEDGARNDLVSYFNGIIEQNGGTVDRIDEWGKRRLAYPINYKTEGYYVLKYIQGPSELPRELERNFQINDNVLRYLVIRYEGELPVKREPLKPFVARDAAPAAPVAPAAPAVPETPAIEVPVPEAAPAVDEEAPVSEAE